jgi:hypothetical protein
MQENRPIYATQGGGYAVYESGLYVWHSEIPDFINAHVGDPIPEEWGVASINEAAHRGVEALDATIDDDLRELGLEM